MMYQCANCEGSGYFDLPDDTEKACSVCGGAGEVDYDAAIARAEAAEAEAERLRAERDSAMSLYEASMRAGTLAQAVNENLRLEAEAETLRAQVAELRGTLGLAAQYVAKAHADGAYTAMSGERALRIIGEALTDNARQDAR